MENKIKLMLYGLFAIVLLTFGFYTTTVRYADALNLSTITTAYHDLRSATYDSSTGRWFYTSPFNNTIISHINNQTTISATPVGGTCTDAKYILSLESSSADDTLAVLCDMGAVPSAHTIEIRQDNSPSIRLDVESSFTNVDRFSGLVEWIGGSRLYVFSSGGTTQNMAMFDLTKINNTSVAMLQQTIDTNTVGNINELQDGVIIEATNELWLAGMDSGLAAGRVGVFNLGTTSMVTSIAFGGAGNTQTSIDYNSVTDKIFVVGGGDSLGIINPDTRAVEVTKTNVCDTGTSLFVEVNENTNQAFILCYVSGTGATNIALYDVTSNSVIAVFSSPSTSSGVQGNPTTTEMKWDDTVKELHLVMGRGQDATTGMNSITIINDPTIGSTGTGTVCLDINFDGTTDVCYEDVNGDNVPDANPIELIRAGQNVTEVGNALACQIGIETACDNPDPKTNGVGYLLVIVLLAFMIVIFALARLKTSLIIPEWLWIIGTFAVLGASIFLGWIDTTLFIIGAVVVVALASFKIVAQFTSGDF